MAQLFWEQGQGPETTSALADIVEAVGCLNVGDLNDYTDAPTLWDIINGYLAVSTGGYVYSRSLREDSRRLLEGSGLAQGSVYVRGNGRDLCVETVRRLRSIS